MTEPLTTLSPAVYRPAGSRRSARGGVGRGASLKNLAVSGTRSPGRTSSVSPSCTSSGGSVTLRAVTQNDRMVGANVHQRGDGRLLFPTATL
ncbi:MAG: hypothetical protein ACLUFV_03545 [Acutalibacteraceae bacterium]